MSRHYHKHLQHNPSMPLHLCRDTRYSDADADAIAIGARTLHGICREAPIYRPHSSRGSPKMRSILEVQG